jgi:hypothetical protein
MSLLKRKDRGFGGAPASAPFARELIDATDGSSVCGLSDRPLARRPWVNDGSGAGVEKQQAWST